MSLDSSKLERFADDLYEAYTTGSPIPPLTDVTEFSVAEAYDIQSQFVDRIGGGDADIAAHKLGLVSEAKQEQLGIQEPIFGYVTEQTVLDEPVIPTDEIISPRIEAEIGLLLDEDISAPASTTDVLQATYAVVPVIEILESRFQGWTIPSAQDVIADNTSAGRIFVGETLTAVTDVDMPTESVLVSVNGNIETTGTGADIMGHPARAVSWLANRLDKRDDVLQAGELVMTGGITAAIDIESGDVYNVTFGSIGSIDLRAE